MTSAKSPENTCRVVNASAADGRFRYERTCLPGDSLIDVSDGKQEWAYLSKKNEYVVSKAGANPLGNLRQSDDERHRLCTMDGSRVRDLAWLRSDTVTLEGRLLASDVITTSDGTYWIEREQHRVVREERVFSNGSRWETEFLLVHLNQEPPPELFVSPVPADAREIEAPARTPFSSGSTWAFRHERALAAFAGAQHEEDRFYALPDAAKAAFELGKIDEARRHAQLLLDLAPRFREDWNYGNAIHDGHMVLGRIAVQRGDLAAAKCELLEAGKTPGSPQLDTNGPNMSLAKDLLERSEVAAVLEYFRLCGAFWEGEPIGGKASAKLELWTRITKAGEIPDFGYALRR